jgi:uncharacterized iron-regulated membrane protein
MDSVPVIFDPETVDLVTLTPDGGSVNLYIVQAEKWSGSDEQLMSLQQKIHNHVSYALDGRMAAAYPETADLTWRIVIDSQKGPLDSRTATVVTQVAEVVRRYNGELVIQS